MIEWRCSRCGALVMTEEDGEEGTEHRQSGLCRDCESECPHRHDDDHYD